MNNLLLLLKIELLNNLKYNEFKYGTKKEKWKVINIHLFMFICTLIISVDVIKGCFYLSDFLMEINQMELLLVIGVIGGSSSTFLASLCKSSSFLFSNKDYDTLGSLPIKHSTILTSKLLVLLSNNYFFTFSLTFIPTLVYFVKMKLSLVYVPYLIILILIVPIIPTLLSSIMAFFISNISFKSKHNHTISLALNILIVLIILFVSIVSRTIGFELIKHSESIITLSKQIYPPVYYFADTLINKNLWLLLIFILISILPAILFIMLFANNYNKLNSRLKEGYVCNSYVFKKLKVSSPLKALFKKDLMRFFSSSVYVINSSISMMILFMFALSIEFIGYDKIATLLEINSDINTLKSEIIGMIAFSIMISNTSCISISMEGKHLWILKSLPIKESSIFKSKILLNILFTVPISTISFLILANRLSFERELIVLVLISIILLAVFSSMLGLFVNLLYPKLDFTNDAQVVKQGASVIINIMCSVIFIILICGIGYALQGTDISKLLIIVNIITFVSILGLFNLLKYKGIKLFKKLIS